MIMGDTCTPTSNPYPQECEMVRSLAARFARRAPGHGRQVEEISEVYFRLISRRVKPGPELAMTFALTSALARIHHLRRAGSDKDARNEFYERMLRSMSHKIPNMKEALGVTPEEFINLLRSDFSQYANISSEAYDLNPDLKLEHYTQLIQDGGLSLRTLIVKLSDFCLGEDDWLAGGPLRVELGEGERRLLSKKMRKVFFPFADGIGWMGAANRIRENSLIWDPELCVKLEEMKAKMGPLRPFYREAGFELEGMIKTVLQMMANNHKFGEHNGILLDANVQPSRVKTEAAIVIKEDEGRDVYDIVADRVVFDCGPDPTPAATLGMSFLDVLKELGLIAINDVNDYYAHPKRSGYQAIHVTGVRQFRGMDVRTELQFQNAPDFRNSCCGKSARTLYKANVVPEETSLIDAVNELIRPVYDAVTDVRGAIDPHPAPLAEKRNGRAQSIFKVHIEGSPIVRIMNMDVGASVIDVLVNVLGGPQDAFVYPGHFIGPSKLSFFDPCLPEIYVRKTGTNFTRKQILDILSRNNVLTGTKKTVREWLGSI